LNKQNYINGIWCDSYDVSLNINPSDTNDIIGVYAWANAEQIKDAISVAKNASASWAYCSRQCNCIILNDSSQDHNRYKQNQWRQINSILQPHFPARPCREFEILSYRYPFTTVTSFIAGLFCDDLIEINSTPDLSWYISR